MIEENEFAEALGRLRHELAGARGTDRLRELGPRLSVLGSAITRACEVAFSDVREPFDGRAEEFGDRDEALDVA